jgi:hypothetical protein
MGAPIILIDHQQQFVEQAQTHVGVSDYVNQTVAGHEAPVETFTLSTIASTMPELGTSYARWWQSKRIALMKYAQAHQMMGDNLRGVVNNFTTLDENSAVALSS